MEWQPPQPTEIDHKLRQDFARRLWNVQDDSTEQTDPILAVLFRSFAAQVAEVYEQAKEALPQAVLAELMAGLGMPERSARAAQTILKFSVPDGVQMFDAGTLLVGEGELREKLTFTLDTPLAVSKAQLAFAALYQDGALRLHQGTELARTVTEARPAFEAVQADLGLTPALFLAVDVDEAAHLSHHGFYFEVNQEARDVAAHLGREVWCLLNAVGGVSAEGLLRPRPGNGGVRRLAWLQGETRTFEEARAVMDAAVLPAGVYGEGVFVLPEIPPERRFLCAVPKQMDGPLRRIFQAAEKHKLDELLAQPRAWIRIGLPAASKTVGVDLARVVLHCTTASNVEVLNQTITFAEDGTAIPVTNGGERVRRLINALSIKGERGADYLPETEPSADGLAGRYRVRQGRLELTPARPLRGPAEARANVRLQLTNGALGNTVGANKLTALPGKSRAVEVRNLTAARGGADGESFAAETSAGAAGKVNDKLFEARKRRFADLLLSRERPVTLPDLEAAVRAFEPKIRAVRAAAALERRADGLHRVQRITVGLKRADFALPEVEAEVLRRELQAELQRRALLGMEVRVASEWLNETNNMR